MAAEAAAKPSTPAPTAEAPAAPRPAPVSEAPIALEKARMAEAMKLLSRPAEDVAAPSEAPASEASSATESASDVPTSEAKATPAKGDVPSTAEQKTDAPADPFAEFRKQLLAEKQAFEAERAKFQKDMEELKEFRSLGEKGKYEIKTVFEKLGLTPEDLIAQAPNGGQLSPAEKRALEAVQRVEALEKQLKERETQSQAAMRQQQEAAFVNHLSTQLDKSEKHELTKALGQDAVLQIKAVMENHWRNTVDPRTGRGEELPFDKAADIVETLLEKQLDTLAEKANKFKTKYSASKSASAPSAKGSTSAKTLTGNMAGATMAPKESSADERYAAALRMLTAKR